MATAISYHCEQDDPPDCPLTAVHDALGVQVLHAAGNVQQAQVYVKLLMRGAGPGVGDGVGGGVRVRGRARRARNPAHTCLPSSFFLTMLGRPLGSTRCFRARASRREPRSQY